MYSLNTIYDRKGDKMRSMNPNVPQTDLINKCSSGSRIPVFSRSVGHVGWDVVLVVGYTPIMWSNQLLLGYGGVGF